METQVFTQKIQLILDAYYDREFFTNLIYLIDRKKTVREIVEASVGELNRTKNWNQDLDKSLLHLFFAHQSASVIRENYQWLPIANALYGCALQRSDGQRVVPVHDIVAGARHAATPQEFESLIRKEVRAVESFETVWSSFLFLVENRSTRAKAISSLLRHTILSSNAITFKLIVKGLESSLASGWRSTAIMMRRPFELFWQTITSPEVVAQGWRLSASVRHEFSKTAGKAWSELWSEEIWKRAVSNSPEAVWQYLGSLAQQSVTIDQAFALLAALRGRILFGMKTEQWPRVTSSIEYAEVLTSASNLSAEDSLTFLAVNVVDFCQLAQVVGGLNLTRPTGKSVLDGVSKNISKDRLIFRLDDSVERGDRVEALELMAVILDDEGLSNSVCDRLLLMAAKQDSWTFDFRSLNVALSLTKAFSACLRLGIRGPETTDALYGLLRFLSDTREISLGIVQKTGTYGDGLSKSQYDVSGGARIIDRFIFNQMRNAQRVKVWPSDN